VSSGVAGEGCRKRRFALAYRMLSTSQDVAAAEIPPAAKADLKRLPLLLLIAGALAVALGIALVPPDKILGANVRLVFFHGAVTWTGIVTTSFSGLAGLGHLIFGRPGASVGWRSLTLGTSFWVASLIISFPVMIRAWGGVPWNEPKLLMSAEIVAALLIAWAGSLIFDRPRVTAVLSVVAATLMGVLLVTTPGAFHPDNPIMSSGDTRFIGSFLLVAAGFVTVAVGVLLFGRNRE
jgi:hypothetical protein